MAEPPAVLRFRDIDQREITALLGQFQLKICIVGKHRDIPGSYWGEEEAGLSRRPATGFYKMSLSMNNAFRFFGFAELSKSVRIRPDKKSPIPPVGLNLFGRMG